MRVMAAIVLGVAVPAVAQEKAAPACTTKPVLPPALAGWSGAAPSVASGGSLTLGRAAQLGLTPASGVRYSVPPEKPGAAGSNGGLASFTVSRAGLYRVALGSGAWVDVVRDGKASVSVAHGHGPACSGIRKMVDFRLTPGRYLLQVAGNAKPVVMVMVAALPG